MGCASSANTSVRPLRPEEEKDETESKLDGRGDSAVSKGTTDSGVVMENRETPMLPGEVPRKLPPLTCVRESEIDRSTQEGVRPESSEILEELLNQGIIPVGQRSRPAGEAYSIMLDDRDEVRRRPPARLESLKENKMQRIPSGEEIEEKMRLAQERRKLREDELKVRLRTKSARVRRPAHACSVEMVDDAVLTPVEPLQHPLSPGPLHPASHSQVARGEAEGGEHVREAVGDGRECREDMSRADRRVGRGEGGESSGEGATAVREEEDEEEEVTQVEELKGRLLEALAELENDSSFQHAEERKEIF